MAKDKNKMKLGWRLVNMAGTVTYDIPRRAEVIGLEVYATTVMRLLLREPYYEQEDEGIRTVTLRMVKLGSELDFQIKRYFGCYYLDGNERHIFEEEI